MLAKRTVLHINSVTSGGPGRVMNTIYDALENRGFLNYVVVPRGKTTKNTIRLSSFDFYFSRILSKAYTVLSTSHITVEPEVYCSKKANRIRKKTGLKVDYIVLYWYKNVISLKDVYNFTSKTGAKLLIYLMDNASMTGGCHYPIECKKYEVGCGSCPSILWGKLKQDITYVNVLSDLYYLKMCSPTILCPTTMSLNEAEKSFKLGKLKKQLLMIPLGEEYSLRVAKTAARSSLGISHAGKVIFFGAEALTHERKGMTYLIKALQKVFESLTNDEKRNTQIIIAGRSNLSDLQKIGFSIKFLGYLDHNMLINAYKAADFFISPSIIDMGPMMVNESIMSGTPVLSFNIGVSKDLVINGITGYQAEVKDYLALSENIQKMIRLTDSQTTKMSISCYKLGEELLSYNTFYSATEKLFTNDVKL